MVADAILYGEVTEIRNEVIFILRLHIVDILQVNDARCDTFCMSTWANKK